MSMVDKIQATRRTKKDVSQLTLLDLPNELLLHVLSYPSILSPKDLYNVAQLSRRFHSLALPVFLAVHDIRDPATETSVYVVEWDTGRNSYSRSRHPDALSGLNISSHIPKINHFRCFFQDPDSKSLRNTFQKAFNLPEAVERVCRFVSRLQGVATAEIFLIWDPYFTTRERNINYVPWAELKNWTRSFGYMLDLLVERGCTSLTVQYDAAILPPFRFRSTNRVKKAVSYISQNLLRLEGQTADLEWEFERSLQEDNSLALEPEPTALLSLSAQAANSVKNLSMHSPVLLLPPFVKWTLSLLRTHSNLTSISFAYIPFSKEIWSTVLPFVADAVSDRLTQLSFFKNCPHLETSDLLQFLRRLLNLTHLSIDRSFRARIKDIKPSRTMLPSPASISLSPPKFPKLHTLQCPLELVTYLLGPQNIPIQDNASLPLPSLKYLTVYPCGFLEQPSDYLQSNLVIGDLLRRLRSQPRREDVVLTLDAQMEFADFGPVVTYIESFNSQRDGETTPQNNHDDVDQQRLEEAGANRCPILFEHVVHIRLYRLLVQFMERTPTDLCIWLNGLFPNAKTVTFTCRLDAHPQQDFHMDEKIIERVVKQLRASCSQVCTLVVGRKTYELG